MLYNPLFIDTSGNDLLTKIKPGKFMNANFMFSDIIKVSVENLNAASKTTLPFLSQVKNIPANAELKNNGCIFQMSKEEVTKFVDELGININPENLTDPVKFEYENYKVTISPVSKELTQIPGIVSNPVYPSNNNALSQEKKTKKIEAVEEAALSGEVIDLTAITGDQLTLVSTILPETINNENLITDTETSVNPEGIKSLESAPNNETSVLPELIEDFTTRSEAPILPGSLDVSTSSTETSVSADSSNVSSSNNGTSVFPESVKDFTDKGSIPIESVNGQELKSNTEAFIPTGNNNNGSSTVENPIQPLVSPKETPKIETANTLDTKVPEAAYIQGSKVNEYKIKPDLQSNLEHSGKTEVPVQTETPVKTNNPLKTDIPDIDIPVNAEGKTNTALPADIQTGAPVNVDIKTKSEVTVNSDVPVNTEIAVETSDETHIPLDKPQIVNETKVHYNETEKVLTDTKANYSEIKQVIKNSAPIDQELSEVLNETNEQPKTMNKEQNSEVLSPQKTTPTVKNNNINQSQDYTKKLSGLNTLETQEEKFQVHIELNKAPEIKNSNLVEEFHQLRFILDRPFKTASNKISRSNYKELATEEPIETEKVISTEKVENTAPKSASINEIKTENKFPFTSNSNIKKTTQDNIDPLKSNSITEELPEITSKSVEFKTSKETREVDTQVQKESKRSVTAKNDDIKPLPTKTEVETEAKSDINAEVKHELKTEQKTDLKTELKAELKADLKTELKAENKTESKVDNKLDSKTEAQMNTSTSKTISSNVKLPVDSEDLRKIRNRQTDGSAAGSKDLKDTVIVNELVSKDKPRVSGITENKLTEKVISIPSKDTIISEEITDDKKAITLKQQASVIKGEEKPEIMQLQVNIETVKTKATQTNSRSNESEENKIEKTKVTVVAKSETSSGNQQVFVKTNDEKVVPEVVSAKPEIIKDIKLGEVIKEIKNAFIDQTSHKVTLNVSPEEMGKIKIEFDVKDNTLNAKIEVESETVKGIIQANSETLRDALHKNGIVLNQLNITLTDSSRQHKPAFTRKKGEKNLTPTSKTEAINAGRKIYGYSTYEFLA